MAPKIFITGVTGYIAGDALYALHQKHPDYEYTAFVRTQAKGDVVKKQYPNIRIVLGGLDNSEIIKDESSKADIVLRRFRHWCFQLRQSLIGTQMLPMLPTMRALPALSPLELQKVTEGGSRGIGCTPEAQAS